MKKTFSNAGRLSLLAIALWANNAAAATATTTMGVSATVSSVCLISANAINLGTYDAVAGTAVTATTTVSATCTSGSTYDVGISVGNGTGATVAARKLTSGANTLTYSLYSDAGHTTAWGDTVGTNTVAGTGNGTAQSITVYGKINASQNVPAGSYSDTVNVTVTY